MEQLDLAYMLFTYGNIYPEKIKKIEEYALNYLYPNHFSEVIKEKYKKRFKELFRHINLLNEPYRVCRRVNILRDYPDDKIKIYP